LILTESRSIGPKTVLFDVPVRNLAWWGLVSGRVEWSSGGARKNLEVGQFLAKIDICIHIKLT
jgi:hypothetical protein